MAQKTSPATLRSMLIGLVVFATFAGSLAIALTASSGLPWAKTTEVKVAFRDVGALRPGDDVRLANLRVGQVKSVDFVDDQAVVSLQLDGEKQVYRNATAVVAARSSLGQKFVDIDPGDASAGELGRDEVIPVTRTRQAHEISEVLDIFDQPTRRGLAGTLQEVGGGVAGHSDNLHDLLAAGPSLLPDLATVSQALTDDGGADLRLMLGAAESLSGRFAQREAEIGELLGNLDRTLQAVAVDNGQPLEQTLTKAPETLRDLRGSLTNLQAPLADTEVAARQLQPGARALGVSTPDVRKILREGVTPLSRLPEVAEQAEPAVTGLTRTLADARPLAPRVTQAFDNAQQPLAVLRPYAPEVAALFNNAGNALSQGDQAGHWLRIFLNIGTEVVTGTLPLEDPMTSRNVYPAPGEAINDKETRGLGTRGQ
jgi:phospholipid/cholesterol/gamma-HCH transport system substrate-binding protein